MFLSRTYNMCLLFANVDLQTRLSSSLEVCIWGIKFGGFMLLESRTLMGFDCAASSLHTFPHLGHTSLDLSWPWNRSTTQESLRSLYWAQASSATTCSQKMHIEVVWEHLQKILNLCRRKGIKVMTIWCSLNTIWERGPPHCTNCADDYQVGFTECICRARN